MLEGDLSDFTLPDILRLLAFTTKTGHLRLEGDRYDGRVDLVDGRVRDASADAKHLPLARRLIGLGHADGDTFVAVLKDRDTLPTDLELARELVRATDVDPDLIATVLREQTVDAVFDLLRWDSGSFRFEVSGERDTSPPDLDLKVDDLLAEADQRLDAWPGIEQRTGAGTAVVSIGRPSGGTADIDAEGWGLLGLIDGHRTVDDLVALSGRGQFDTRRLLGTLVDLGVISIGAPGRGGAIEKLMEDHRALARLESSLEVGDARPAAATPGPGAFEPVPTSGSSHQDPATTGPSAQRAASGGGWPSETPTELPAPAATPEAPSMSAADELPASDAAKESTGPSGPSAVASGDDTDDSTPLRMRVRSERLTTDPTVDTDLVTRLIDGVEGL